MCPRLLQVFLLFCTTPPPPNLTGCFQINPTVSVCDRELFFGGFLEYSAGFVPPRGSDYIPEKDTKHPGCPDFLLFFLCTSSDCSQWTCGDFHMFMWLVGYGPLPLLLVLFGGHQVIDHTILLVSVHGGKRRADR